MAQISVVLCCYNHEQYIEEAIESVFQQTEVDLELIVVDDCSTDGSVSRIRAMEARSPIPMRVIEKPQNRGLVHSFNIGFEIAEGDYFAILASDDAYRPDRFREQIAVFEARPAVQVVYGFAMDFSGESFEENAGALSLKELTPEEFLDRHYVSRTYLYMQAMLIRRQVWEGIGGLDEDIITDDWQFMVKTHEYLRDTGYAYEIIETPLFLRRIHATNKSRENFSNIVKILHMQRRFVPDALKARMGVLNFHAEANEAYAKHRMTVAHRALMHGLLDAMSIASHDDLNFMMTAPQYPAALTARASLLMGLTLIYELRLAAAKGWLERAFQSRPLLDGEAAALRAGLALVGQTEMAGQAREGARQTDRFADFIAFAEPLTDRFMEQASAGPDKKVLQGMVELITRFAVLLRDEAEADMLWQFKTFGRGMTLADSALPESDAAFIEASSKDADLGRRCRIAAVQSNTEAQRWLGKLYEAGHAVHKSGREAALWYLKAAAGGDSEAALGLAKLIGGGELTPANPALATIWLVKAARGNIVEAQLRLGLLLHAQGDLDKAAWYLEKAALNGGAEACLPLARCFEAGAGGPPDALNALAWAARAAKAGAEGAQDDVNRLIRRIPPADHGKARHLLDQAPGPVFTNRPEPNLPEAQMDQDRLIGETKAFTDQGTSISGPAFVSSDAVGEALAEVLAGRSETTRLQSLIAGEQEAEFPSIFALLLRAMAWSVIGDHGRAMGCGQRAMILHGLTRPEAAVVALVAFRAGDQGFAAKMLGYGIGEPAKAAFVNAVAAVVHGAAEAPDSLELFSDYFA